MAKFQKNRKFVKKITDFLSIFCTKKIRFVCAEWLNKFYNRKINHILMLDKKYKNGRKSG